jgi:hypothetical protein
MANQKATPNAIQLTSLLNMQRDKSDIVPYNRFNLNNAPYYGGTLSPFWAQEGDAGNSATFDKDGNKWTFENGLLKKNENYVRPFNSYGFKKEVISGDNLYAYTEYVENGELHKVKVLSAGLYSYNINIDGQIKFYEDILPLYVSAKYLNGLLVVVASTGSRIYADIFQNGEPIKHQERITDKYNGLIVIASDSNQPDFIFIQSMPGIGPVNKEMSDNYAPIWCYHISGNAFYNFKLTNQNDYEYTKYPILLDDATLFYGRPTNLDVNVTPNTGLPLSYHVSATAPTISGTDVTFGKTIDWDIWPSAVTYGSGTSYQGDVMAKCGTILSPYFFRQSIEFNDTGSKNPYNIVCDKGRGYMLHTGYTEQDGNLYFLVPFIERYRQTGTYNGKQGYWSLAYNNGYISGIGFCGSRYGALLSDWLDFDNEALITFADDFVIYKNNAGDYVKVTITDTPDWRIKLIGANVIVNTIDEINAINSEYNGIQKFTWATMYNGDVIVDKYYHANITVNASTPFYPVEIFAAAINPNYEQNVEQVPSAVFAPIVCQYATMPKVATTLDASSTLNYVEVYLSRDNSVPKFWGFVSTGKMFIDYKHQGLTYPIDSSGNPLLSPSLFAELIQSGVKKDMLINGGSAYPLQYYDNTIPIYLYYLLSGVTGLKNVFILQGTVYGVTDENILLLSYSDSVVSGIDVIAIKANMRYLGATPYTAYFWSEQNKSIYEFQGDRLLRKLYEANEINEIYTTSYNSATYTLFIATDKGVYCVGDSMYRIEINTVSKIEQTDTDTILFYTDENSAEKCLLIRYDSAPGYERQKLHLCTSFYGAGVNVVSVLDTWYIHFYNNGLAEDGEIKLRLETLTNTGRKTETKIIKVKKTDWDELTNTYYLRYQPQYQRSIGASLDIVSDFAIRDFAVTSQADTLQIGGSV